MKHDNASILLADGSPIGAQQISVKYKDSSGSIGKMIKAVETCRGAFESASPGQSYDPLSEELLLLAIQEKLRRRENPLNERKQRPVSLLKQRILLKMLEGQPDEIDATIKSLSSNFICDSAIRYGVTTQIKCFPLRHLHLNFHL
eukprot:scaffold221_cov191-Chaetoceros_neogracile.AAC.1